jgi:hypothetical protein
LCALPQIRVGEEEICNGGAMTSRGIAYETGELLSQEALRLHPDKHTKSLMCIDLMGNLRPHRHEACSFIGKALAEPNPQGLLPADSHLKGMVCMQIRRNSLTDIEGFSRPEKEPCQLM